MRRLISVEKRYGRRIWIGNSIGYVTKAAVVIICLIAINFVSVKAFDLNLWQTIVTKTGEFIHVSFKNQNNENVEETSVDIYSEPIRMKISKAPKGYKQQEFYYAENMTVQQLVSENGTITYTESLITETVDVSMAKGQKETDSVRGYEVSYFIDEDSICAFFCDDEFYHIISIQGDNANRKFVDKIIEELEVC